jgi:hypothetical protein
LRLYALRARSAARKHALDAWQAHFNLPAWARETAERTISVWMGNSRSAGALKFHVPLRARNIAAEGLPTFHAEIERDYHKDTPWSTFKGYRPSTQKRPQD